MTRRTALCEFRHGFNLGILYPWDTIPNCPTSLVVCKRAQIPAAMRPFVSNYRLAFRQCHQMVALYLTDFFPRSVTAYALTDLDFCSPYLVLTKLYKKCRNNMPIASLSSRGDAKKTIGLPPWGRPLFHWRSLIQPCFRLLITHPTHSR